MLQKEKALPFYTTILEKGKIKRTLYKIGESLRPSIGRSWTISYKKAKEFACQYAEGAESTVVPIVYHGIAHKVKKGLFWDSEKEVHISKDKSRLKHIEIIERKDCENITKTLEITIIRFYHIYHDIGRIISKRR